MTLGTFICKRVTYLCPFFDHVYGPLEGDKLNVAKKEKKNIPVVLKFMPKALLTL